MERQMFAGHFAAGLAAKKISPRTSLPVLIGAATFLDIIWPPLVLLGIEHVKIDPGNTVVAPLDFSFYPYSHSLMLVILWSLLLGAVYFYFTKNKKGALVVGLLVASHWFLDLLVHRPDLPLAPGLSLYFGFGLWDSVLWTAVLELGMFSGAVWFYAQSTRSMSWGGRISFLSFVCIIFGIQVMNYTGSPPPSVEAVGWVGMFSTFLFLAWAWIIEKKRYVYG